jgi:very-short-patch-repair endonuclease
MTRPLRPDDVLAAVAATQFGCFTTHQAIQAGFTRATVHGRVRDRLWRSIHPGVLVAATTPLSRAVFASAARLRVGEDAMFSDFTGARLLGMDIRHDDDDIWLRAPMECGLRSWLGVHVTRSRHPVQPVLAHGQPVVPPARTLVDLAGRLSEQALTGLLYDVTRRRVLAVDDVAATAEAIGGGFAGLKTLRKMLTTFDPAFEAMVEARVGAALAEAGLNLTPQVEVWDGPFLVARLDLADDEVMLGVEIDGFRYHSSRDAQKRDRTRDRRSRALGWTILRFDATDALNRLSVVVRDVTAVRNRLLAERRLVG